MTTDADITLAESNLVELDPKLGAIIRANGHLNRVRTDGTYFANLTRSIVGQQISVLAARAILGRLQGATDLDPHRVAALTPDELRALGLSRAKGRYVQDLAAHVVEDAAVFDHLDQLSDEEVITELVRVKGIGVWTAHMFLMFTLGRPDVFAPDDVGLQRAIVRLYGLETVPPKPELSAIADHWRPYRTIACWHLWHSLDNTPVGDL